MPIIVPNAVNYPSPLVSVATKYKNAPKETPRMIQCEIAWQTTGFIALGATGNPNSINVNLSNNQTLEFSQIVSLSVDNSQCGSDVQFVFPDTAETVTIPAYSPKVIVPVFTNGLQFFVVAISAVVEVGYLTRFSIHNTVPPPLAVPVTQEQQFVSVNSINVTASGNQQIIPLGVNGTLQSGNVQFQLNSASTGTVTWMLQDGTGKNLAAGQVAIPNAGNITVTPWSMNGIAVPFQNGVKLIWVDTGTVSAGSAANVNLYYRSP